MNLKIPRISYHETVSGWIRIIELSVYRRDVLGDRIVAADRADCVIRVLIHPEQLRQMLGFIHTYKHINTDGLKIWKIKICIIPAHLINTHCCHTVTKWTATISNLFISFRRKRNGWHSDEREVIDPELNIDKPNLCLIFNKFVNSTG